MPKIEVKQDSRKGKGGKKKRKKRKKKKDKKKQRRTPPLQINIYTDGRKRVDPYGRGHPSFAKGSSVAWDKPYATYAPPQPRESKYLAQLLTFAKPVVEALANKMAGIKQIEYKGDVLADRRGIRYDPTDGRSVEVSELDTEALRERAREEMEERRLLRGGFRTRGRGLQVVRIDDSSDSSVAPTQMAPSTMGSVGSVASDESVFQAWQDDVLGEMERFRRRGQPPPLPRAGTFAGNFYDAKKEREFERHLGMRERMGRQARVEERLGFVDTDDDDDVLSGLGSA